MEDLRTRKSSLDPPYPTFAEFVQKLLGEKSARDIAAGFVFRGEQLYEKTIIGWSAGHSPNNNLRDQIERQFGYIFSERAFYEAAHDVGFPPANADDDLRKIQKFDDLKLYLMLVREGTRLEAMTNYFGFSSASILGDFLSNDERGLSAGTLAKIFGKLPAVPRHLSGDILSELTPAFRVGEVLRACRHKRGMRLGAYARHLGVSDALVISLEEYADNPNRRRSLLKNAERYHAVLAKLMSERVELGLAAEIDDAVCETETSLAAPSVETSEETVVAPSALVVDEGARVKPPTPTSGDVVSGEVAELRRQIELLWQAIGAKNSKSHAGVTPYRSPFTPERWREHDTPIDLEFVTAVRDQIMALCENLGVLAGVRDETQRARIRVALEDTLLVELLGAIEAFVQKYPGEALRLLESRRQFFSGLKR